MPKDPVYFVNLVRGAIKYRLALWRQLREIETQLGIDIDGLDDIVEVYCVGVDDPEDDEDVAPLVNELYEIREKSAYAIG